MAWIIAGALLLAAIVASVWGFWIEPRRLRLRKLAVQPTGWPEDQPAIRLGLMTDLHAGSLHITLDRIADLVSVMNAHAPDLILLGGDYVDQRTYRRRRSPAPEEIAGQLAKLQAPLGVFAVLGNHDWRSDGERIRRSLQAAGIVVLENKAASIAGAGRPLWIAGMADDGTRTPDVPGTLGRIPPGEAAIVLTHDPAVFAEMPRGPYLTLAGHTHGGQVRIPGLGALVLPGRAPLRWSYGHIVEDGRDLLVSGGLGTSLLPVRFNMPPELVFVTVKG